MNNIKKIASLLIVLTMIFTLAACGQSTTATDTTSKDTTSTDATSTDTTSTDTTSTDSATSDAKVLVGEVTVSGSTSVEKIGVAAGDEFMAQNPGVAFTYESIGSSGGVKNANERVTNIGAASRNLKDSEKDYGMTEVVIAYDGIAVVVNPANEAINELTMDQVLAIYKGEITNWNEVGGADQEISVVSREDGSGTRGAFEELVGFEDMLTPTAVLKDGNGNVQATVAENPNAIGYVSFTYLDETIKGIEVDGALPTVDNVLNGSFPISRPFIMMYHDDNMNDVANAFIDFMLSDDGQAIVEAKGGIKVK